MTDVGARLREARERKGLPLKHIAAATKISLHSLEALERNDMSRLPGGIFSRAFVRSYALEVGLDPDEILREFLAQSGDESFVPLGVSPPPSARDGPGPSLGIRGAAADEGAFESQQRVAAVVVKLVLISLAVSFAILFLSLQRRAPGTADHGQVESGAGATPAVEPPKVDPAAAIATAPAASPPTADLAVTPLIWLEVGPTRECWVKLIADGEVVLSRVLAAGEREAHAFRQSAVLQVGDAEACALSINGRPARPLGHPRQVRQLVLTRDNYRGFLQ